MRNSKPLGLIAALSWMFAVATSNAADIDIPYTEFTLDNGLRVIVHEITKHRSLRSTSGTTLDPRTRNRARPASHTCSNI